MISASVSFIAVFAVFFLIFASRQTVNGIKCFECNSHNDSKCADEKPPDNLRKDCKQNIEGHKYTLCRKIVQTIEYEVNGLQPDTRIIRSCGWDESNYATNCYQRSGFGGRQEVCSCKGDFCNAAIKPNGNIQFIIVTSIFSSLLLISNVI